MAQKVGQLPEVGEELLDLTLQALDVAPTGHEDDSTRVRGPRSTALDSRG
jgi:hypothetical protein